MYCKSLSLIFISLLTACGGGSSTDSSDDNISSNGTNQAALNTLSMMAKYTDSCGNETAAGDAALLIHNSDYSNKEIVYADDNGKITYQTEDSNQTISIVMRGSEEINGIKPIFLTTYVDHPIVDLGDYYHYNNSTVNCQCQTFDLNVNTPARANDIGTGRISGVADDGHIDNNYGYTSYIGLESCKSPTEQWPLISSLISYRNPEQSFAALISDISTTTEISAEIEGTVVDISTNDYEATRQVSTVIDGIYHLRNYAFDQGSNVYGYAAESAQHFSISAYKFESLYDIPNVDDAFFWTASREYSSVLDKTFDLPLPTMDYTKLFDILVSTSGQYDLSNVANMDYLTVGIEAASNHQTMLDWYLYAPISGQVPKIENIDISAFISDDVLDASIDTIEMSVSARGYVGIDGYQDYLSSKSELTTDNLVNDQWSKSDFVYFEMTTSDFSISNSIKSIGSAKVTKEHISNQFIDKTFNNSLIKALR